MKGHLLDYELGYIIWKGIHEAINKAVERRDPEAYLLLKEAVEYYNENFVLSGRELERMLKKLESLSKEA